MQLIHILWSQFLAMPDIFGGLVTRAAFDGIFLNHILPNSPAERVAQAGEFQIGDAITDVSRAHPNRILAPKMVFVQKRLAQFVHVFLPKKALEHGVIIFLVVIIAGVLVARFLPAVGI